MPSLTLKIAHGGDRSKRILTALKQRHQISRQGMQKRHEQWRKNEEMMLAYLPEKDVDAARRVNRDYGGNPEYTTIVMPYTYAMLMTAHTYWTTVFLGRDPILQYTGRHGETEHQTQALEALMAYQVQVGGMLVPFYIWLLDVGKYGLGVVHTYWEEETAKISTIQEVPETVFFGAMETGRKVKQRITQTIKGYHGNKLKNVRPLNWFPDTRVPINQFQSGEFCGLYGELGWNEILRREDKGYYTNLEYLRRYGRPLQAEESQGSGQLELPDSELMVDAPGDMDQARKEDRLKANVYGLYDFYVEVVPSDWGVGDGSMPEKWHFTCDKEFQVLIGARPLGTISNRFPFEVLEMEPEAYALHGRGLPEILEPVQNTMDWLINSHFYNVRKALNHQLLVDPTRVVMKDLLNPSPGKIVRVAPQGYGQDVRTAIHQLNFADVTQAHLNDLGVMHEFGQRFVGITDQLMGLLQGGGRKSATEVRTGANFGVNRQKTNTEYFSAMGFAPLSMQLLQNTQQYYDGEQKFRIVGDLVTEAGQQFVDVSPEAISGFYDFVPVDGTLPVDRFAQANLWQQMFAQISRMPQVSQQYDLGRIFGWVATLAGLKNINKFKIQVMPDAMAAAQAQQGNLVPQGGEPPAPSPVSLNQ